VGWKLTLIVQLTLGAMEGRQLLLCVQSVEITKLVMFSATGLVFVTVTGWEALVAPTSWLLKVRLPGETVGADTIAVPVSPTVWGLPVALSVIVTVPLRLPVAVGVKVTSIVQLVPGATVPPP
jgi:hypothetical protein